MVEIEKIRQLIEMMVANDLVEISLRNGSEEVSLRRPNAPVSFAPMNPSASALAAPGGNSSAMAGGPAEQSLEHPAERLVEIISPMVGTFYSSPDPESPAFVEVGAPIQSGAVVCIVEAMKVFNEIKSEVAGIIERILVKNAQTVEYGQALFLVRPH